MWPTRYRFHVLGAFSPPSSAPKANAVFRKEALFNNFDDLATLFDSVEWDAHPGPPIPYGSWPPVTRAEFAAVGTSRQSLVRKACDAGVYDAIVMLGGGDPGLWEAREIGHQHGVPVVGCAHAQMMVAGMLGQRFSIICISEAHNMRMADLVVQYRLADRCVSICSLEVPLPRPSYDGDRSLHRERLLIDQTGTSEMLDDACRLAVEAIEADGAETLMLGCSALYWLRPHLKRRLEAMGWDVPVLEGHSAAIAQAKLLADLALDASGLAFPRDPPGRSRRRKRV